ncbi:MULTISPECIES: transcriptional repressor LexA [unclassified Lacrimispora]|uniref:transcriptional repressor LexA n=1 Tax=unclassified Lacrimispora TaxID=2719232 RepID=UPI00376F46FC
MRNARMSKIQKQIYDYVKDSINDRGYPPAVREIGDMVNLKSTSSVHSHLKKLEDMGYIKRDPAKPRAIEIVEDCFNLEQRNVKVPLLGTVAAGQPLYAEQNIEEYWTLPIETINYKESFLLKVKGSSMVNANIIDGDIIIVNVDSTADNGEIVVALIDDSATVKRFFKEDGYYRLQPENDSMSPIIVDHVEILGKVIGVFRVGIH